MKNGLIAILVMAVLVSPVCAQAGNLGHDPMYPALPQKDATPDYLLVNEVGVTVDAGAKEATLQFDTLLATPGAKIYYGLYVPEQEIQVPQATVRYVACNTGSEDILRALRTRAGDTGAAVSKIDYRRPIGSGEYIPQRHDQHREV
jgi:hypothetical protein